MPRLAARWARPTRKLLLSIAVAVAVCVSVPVPAAGGARAGDGECARATSARTLPQAERDVLCEGATDASPAECWARAKLMTRGAAARGDRDTLLRLCQRAPAGGGPAACAKAAHHSVQRDDVVRLCAGAAGPGPGECSAATSLHARGLSAADRVGLCAGAPPQAPTAPAECFAGASGASVDAQAAIAACAGSTDDEPAACLRSLSALRSSVLGPDDYVRLCRARPVAETDGVARARRPLGAADCAILAARNRGSPSTADGIVALCEHATSEAPATCAHDAASRGGVGAETVDGVDAVAALCRYAGEEDPKLPSRCFRSVRARSLSAFDKVLLCASPPELIGTPEKSRSVAPNAAPGPAACASEAPYAMDAPLIVRLCRGAQSSAPAHCAAAVRSNRLSAEARVGLCALATSSAPAQCAAAAPFSLAPHLVLRLCARAESDAPARCVSAVSSAALASDAARVRVCAEAVPAALSRVVAELGRAGEADAGAAAVMAAEEVATCVASVSLTHALKDAEDRVVACLPGPPADETVEFVDGAAAMPPPAECSVRCRILRHIAQRVQTPANEAKRVTQTPKAAAQTRARSLRRVVGPSECLRAVKDSSLSTEALALLCSGALGAGPARCANAAARLAGVLPVSPQQDDLEDDEIDAALRSHRGEFNVIPRDDPSAAGQMLASAIARVQLCRGAFDDGPTRCLRRVVGRLAPGDAIRLCAGSWGDARGPPTCASDALRRFGDDASWTSEDIVRLCQRSSGGDAAMCAFTAPSWLGTDRTIALCSGAPSVAPALCAVEAEEFPEDPDLIVQLCRGVEAPAAGACAASLATYVYTREHKRIRQLAPEMLLACRSHPLEPAELVVTDAAKHCDVLLPNCTFSVTVGVVDQYGHTFHGDGVSVHARVKGGVLTGVQLDGETTRMAEDGRAEFHALRIPEIGDHTVAFRAVWQPEQQQVPHTSQSHGFGDGEVNGADGRLPRPLPPHVVWDDAVATVVEQLDDDSAGWADLMRADAAFWRGHGWRVLAASNDDGFGEYVWISAADAGVDADSVGQSSVPPTSSEDEVEGDIIPAEIAVTVYSDGSEQSGPDGLFRRGGDGLVGAEHGSCLYSVFSHLRCPVYDVCDAAHDATRSSLPRRWAFAALSSNCSATLDSFGVQIQWDGGGGDELWVEVGRRGPGWLLTHELPRADMSAYERLGVSEGAPLREIRRAYYDRSLDWHPDKWAQQPLALRDRVAQAFTLVSEAYNMLATSSRSD